MHEHCDRKFIQRYAVRKVKKEEIDDGEKSSCASSVALTNLLSSVIGRDAVKVIMLHCHTERNFL